MDTIDLLIFSVQNLVFGVWAQQVEELLKAENRLDLAEADKEYTIPYRQRDLRVIDFSKYLKLRTPRRELQKADSAFEPQSNAKSPFECTCNLSDDSFFSSKILVIKNRKHEYMGIHVENVKHIVTMTFDHIYALPKIMEQQKQIAELWGIAFFHEEVVLLIDLTQLA
ncbi:hypothetical protein U27_07037 [Candidatus Vecturithrix granuli]|uniref:CheW-like domain-containing protein n=1 Tax=Vecturithrix granuli TaxID=1499967 RepID=A0A081C645_VECG1|nr:hypothetical protein U27_07037 [Candidatus Vecturithrix granuli]